MSYKLIVFDWDGTLADSLQQIVTSMQNAIDSLKLEQRDSKSIRNIIGLGLDEASSTLYPDLSEDKRAKLVQYYREHYLAETNTPVRLFDGVKQMLKELQADDYLLAVATGKSRRGLDRAMRESGVEDMFHTTRCADETFSKPHPQMLHDIMSIFAMEAKDTLMIGDSEHDLQMAKNADVAAIAVSYGAQDEQRLQEFQPLMCVDDLRKLPRWLKN